MRNITITLKIECDKDAEINPLHVAEEVQSYLDAHSTYFDTVTEDYRTPLIKGYLMEWDRFTPVDFKNNDEEDSEDTEEYNEVEDAASYT